MRKDNLIFGMACTIAVLSVTTFELATSELPKAVKADITPTMIATPTPAPDFKWSGRAGRVLGNLFKSVPTPTQIPKASGLDGQTEFKTYERYTAITRKDSEQYKLQQIAVTGDYGIRMVDGRYCVALGSRWSTVIGEKLDVYMEDGTVIPVILGDCKQDRHTDSTNSWGTDNGDVLEFIIDKDAISDEVRLTGSLNCIFPGKVRNIIKAREEE